MRGPRPDLGRYATLASNGGAPALAVGILVLVLALLEVGARYVPHTWIQRDGRFYTNVNVTLVERASVDQGEFCASWYEGNLGWNRSLDAGWSNVALGRDERRLPKHPILLPLLATPWFWAFGLHGTLLFNVLLFGVAGAAAFAVARRYASSPAAAFAALALPLATGIRDHAYDYHVDVLMLALFTSGVALAHARRGFWAGVLIGATVVLRPTALLWVPSLVLLLAAHRDWRTLRFALLGGALPLLAFAASNHWLYGRPWWSGYNRVLVVVDGEPRLADVSDAFGVPWREGLEALWSGPYGVRHRLTLVLAALPGLVVLLRRRPAYVLAAVLAVAASVLVFARYRWYGDRFLWPSAALLAPALAVTFDAAARLVRRRPWWRPALVAGLGAAAIVVAQGALGPPWSARSSEDLTRLALHAGLVALLAAGLTRAAERTKVGAMALLAPLAWLLVPEVRERALHGGPDLYLATAIALALGARHGLASLAFALLAGVTALLGPASLDAARFGALDAPALRPALALLAAGALALPWLGRHAALLLPLAALALPRVAALGGDRLPLFALALLCLPLPALASGLGRTLARAWRDAGRPRRLAALGLPLAALFLLGLVPRLRDEPFRIASYRGVRTARVQLGTIPCDFLAWEHLNWECATFDRGVHGETGLSTSQPLHVRGQRTPAFLISAQSSRPRIVRWDDLPASGALALRWAVPDELRGGGTLAVRVDGRELAAYELPREPTDVQEARLDTAAFEGRRVSLELELRGLGSAVVVDGGFVP